VDANRLEVNGLAKLTLLDRHSEARCKMVPSCMSSLRFGMTKEIVGKVVKLVVKLVKGWLLALGTLEKFTHGCLARVSAGSADSGSG